MHIMLLWLFIHILLSETSVQTTLLMDFQIWQLDGESNKGVLLGVNAETKMKQYFKHCPCSDIQQIHLSCTSVNAPDISTTVDIIQ